MIYLIMARMLNLTHQSLKGGVVELISDRGSI